MSAQETHPGSAGILIVDDDPDISRALMDFLEHEGYHVTVVGTGKDAMAQVRQRRYEAVILDIGLPDVDGFTVLRMFQEVDPKLPVIILTAYTTPEKTIATLMQGAFAYLTKPYNRDELKAVLRRAIGTQALAVKAETIEHALMASEERFRSVVESATDAIILADHNGLILSWNKAAARLFGYTQEEVAGRPLTLLMPARYRAAHERGLERLRSTGETRVIGKTLELHGLRRDGNEFPLELSLAAWKTKEDTFFSGVIRDITERKRVEESLQQSEERLRLALAAARLGTWDWDIQTGKVVWSENVESLFGLPRGGFAGTYSAFLDLIHPEDRSGVVQAITRASEEGVAYRIEHRIIWPDKSVRWLGCTGQVLRDETGRAVRMLGTVQCITDRKQAEAALRESEERFRQLSENIREVFWMTDPEKHQMLYISPAYEEIWGRTCASLYASPRSWLDAIHPEDRDRVLTAATTKQVPGEYAEEYRIVRPDGSVRWILDRAFPIRDTSGQVYRIAGIAEDITERKRT
ncbi:MAG: PAS domain S-box protein [Nitrospiraceae bacterium]